MNLLSILFFIPALLFSLACERSFTQKDPTFRKKDGYIRPIREASGSNQCANLDDCAQACDHIYFTSDEKERCKKLSIGDAESVYKVARYIEQPEIRQLRRIQEYEWELFLSIGLETINEYIFNYTISESRRVLTWLAEERGVSRVLFNLGPRSYRQIMLGLFLITDPPEKALHRPLSYGDTFYRISNNTSNDYAIYMAHQVITDDLCEVSQYYSGLDLLEVREACVLRVYCHEEAGEYIHANDFRYISKVIEYDDIFDYIQEPDTRFGLGLQHYALHTEVCDIVCNLIPGSCSITSFY